MKNVYMFCTQNYPENEGSKFTGKDTPPPLIQEFLTLALDYINIYNNLEILLYISSQKCSTKNAALAATDKRTVYKATVTSYSISNVHLGSKMKILAHKCIN